MAAGPTYEPIATQTLGSAAASVTFSSISGSYTDLVLIENGGNSTAGQAFIFQVGNGSIDTGSNYSYTILNGTGSAATSYRYSSQTSGIFAWSGPPTSIGDIGIAQFMNYSNTTTYKTVLVRYSSASGTNAGTDAMVSLWRSTSAINTIKVSSISGNILAGSTFTLYGIKAA
jgi:hypothetical protein